MEFSYNKLRGRIVEKYGTMTSFAESFGISNNSLSLKLNNKTNFSVDDILKICEMLEISSDSIPEYFFVQKV